MLESVTRITIMETLGALFGSEARVKIMRLFLFNSKRPFAFSEILGRAKVKPAVGKRELLLLRKSGLIHSKPVVMTVTQKRGKKEFVVKKREVGYVLNDKFPFLLQLQNLLIYTVLIHNDEVTKRVSATGRIKLIIVSGVFLQDVDRRIDLFVVGDNIKPSAFEGVVRSLEAEIGKELRYAFFSTTEFQYRLGMYDKLIRDILDYPHKIISDKMGFADTRPRNPVR